jgi:hypothetical protein
MTGSACREQAVVSQTKTGVTMRRQSTTRRTAWAGLIVSAILSLFLAACAEEQVQVLTPPAGATTQASTTTTEATTTTTAATTTLAEATTTTFTPSAPNPMTLFITAADLGAGWVVEENEIPHPEPIPTSGVLCADGQAIADALAPIYRDQLWVIFVPEGLDTSSSFVSEIMLQEEPEQNLSHFTTLVSALDACIDVDPSEMPSDPGWGVGRIERMAAPAMGDQSYAFRLTVSRPGEEPWLETRQIGVRIGRFTIQVTAAVNCPSSACASLSDLPTVDDAELIRLAQVAVANIAAVPQE